MKKILILFALLIVGFYANAQFTSGYKLPAATTDSIKSGSLTVTKTFALTAGYSTVSIQPVVTKVSGTVAGTVVLYGTVDGTNYVSTGDTLTLTDVATKTVIWNVTPAKHAKYRVVAVGTGTMNALLSVWYLARHYKME